MNATNYNLEWLAKEKYQQALKDSKVAERNRVPGRRGRQSKRQRAAGVPVLRRSSSPC